MRINIVGDIFNSTGYASHTRQLFNALYKVADVKLSTQLFPGWERLANDAELDAIMKPSKENDINLIITTPHNWKMFLGLGMNIGYCVWEGDKVPACWLEEFQNDKIDLIFVPSQHTYNAIMNTWNDYYDDKAIEKRLRIIPHGVDLSIFKKVETPRENNKFTFVCNKGWRGTSWDRGGVQYLLRAFNEEFSKDDNVQLIIKLNPAYVNLQQLQAGIDVLHLQKDKADFKIFLNDAPMNELYKIYNMGDVYICPTRAEAFDLGTAEAMACGLPIITTKYGGQIEHMNNENALFIKYILSEVKEDMMYEGIQWATLDINDLRKKLRWCYEHQDEVKKMGLKSLEIIKDWTWDDNAKKIVEAINSIDKK